MDINSIGASDLTALPPSTARQQGRGTAQQQQPGAAPVEGRAPVDRPAPGNAPQAVFARRPAADVNARERDEAKEREASFQEQLEESVEELNEFVLPYNTALRFSIEKDSGAVIVKVMDRETEEVVKQIPSEEAIALARALDKLKGLLVQQQA
ncbi:MAG: flagellar protein FlaG [Zoogloeaceae bacterium]|jgi:flagellar protein FlaG|nr:flagellar protein FlaG [Zoogloeaceae bacterium]